jgi:CO/xanthine dehydrogenase Mo-binding subunit
VKRKPLRVVGKSCPSLEGLSEPYGAKGVGEVPLFGIAPAVANAVASAIGVRIKDLPITAEKILAERKRKETEIGND